MRNLYELANKIQAGDVVYVGLCFGTSVVSTGFTKEMMMILADECNGLVNNIYSDEDYADVILSTKHFVEFDVEVETHVLSVLEYDCKAQHTK